MALELRQQLKLSQQLAMTPQLQQAIKLLQLSRIELVDMVQSELLENPFLEEETAEDTPEKSFEDRKEAPDGDEIYDQEAARNADWEDYLGDFASSSRQASTREVELPEDSNFFETRYAARSTLAGHLLWQLRLSRLDEKKQEIGETIINNLGSNGYLESTLEEIAATVADCAVEEVEPVLEVVQRFDPVGVAARTPQECLMVQLEVLHYDRDPVLVSLVREHLEDLESRRYKPIMRKFRLTEEDLKEYLGIIQSLDPLPGASFGDVEPQYVSPDVYVYKFEDEFVVVLNEDGLPQLHLSSLYEDSLSIMGGKDKEYLQERLRSASWLIKSLHQRQRTLYKVVEAIVRFQKDFFDEGPARLRPLILKEIAEDVGMHESTISRVTTNKYVATPHGLFELKFFFNSALALADGSEVGSESVKLRIKKYISVEDPKSPLSDERIVEMLTEELGVNIARRTVAKYRGALGIDSSSKRRAVF